MNHDLYPMIFKRKSFHLFRNVGDLKITEEEKEEILSAWQSFVPLCPDIRTAVRIVKAEETTCARGEEYCLLLYSEKKDHWLQNIGYLGEQLDLYLVSKDIGTLWFGIGRIEEPSFEDLEFVIMIAIHKIADKAKFRKDMYKSKRKPLDEIWQSETIEGVSDIVRFAPSACNTQPWFVKNEEQISVFRYKKPGKRGIMPVEKVTFYNQIDIGIFLCFLELCLDHEGYTYSRQLFTDEGKESELELTLNAVYDLKKETAACQDGSCHKEDTMIIKAVKFRKDGFYGQPFAFGGEEGTDKFDPNIRYRGSLQNYLIDTGDEVILVDTGLPAGTPEEKPDEKTAAFTGKDICSYMDAFKALGYRPEQVTKILLTHKHGDHSGEIRSFPNAKIYAAAEEFDVPELQGVENGVPVRFTDGAYYNFPESQKIADGIYLIRAKGHTYGNSLVIVENEGLFYMFEADITYVDEALYENKLSVVYDDLSAARETLDRVREFVRNHPTVYCGTHTPQGYENLEAKRVMDLDNPVETIFEEYSFGEEEASGKYVCSICGYVYDPAEHDGVAFEDLPDDWKCPRCRQGKEKFNKA